MPTVLTFTPVIIVAMIVQFAISASWSMPWFRYGLPLFQRSLPKLTGRSTSDLVAAFRIAGFSVAVRELSAEEIGLRGSLVFGFSGVQARILNASPPCFVA